MKKHVFRNLLFSAAILGLTLTQLITPAHGSIAGHGPANGSAIQNAADDSQPSQQNPLVLPYDQSDLNIINGFYLDLIDKDLVALAGRGLSGEEVEALTNEMAEAQFILNFVAIAQAQFMQLGEEDEFCKAIRTKVEEISSRICDLNRLYKEAHCDEWYHVPSVCEMYCLPEKNAAAAAYQARSTAQVNLMNCLGQHPEDADVACAELIKTLAAAIAAEKAADAALEACIKSCNERLGNIPHPTCKQLSDDIKKAENELKTLCSPFNIGPNGQPTDNPNSNATCPACKEVTSTGYQPIKCHSN